MATTTPTEIADPTLSLRLGGSPVAPGVRQSVVGVDLSEDVYRHGRLTLLVDATAENQAAYALGAEIVVAIGTRAAQVDVFDGVLTAVTAHFPGGGSGPTLQVEARSRSVLLDPPRPRVLEDLTDADLAKELARVVGLTARTDPAGPSRAVVHIAGSPWGYLVERGRRLGWATYVRGKDLVHRPPAPVGGDRVAVDWQGSLAELHLAQDLLAAAPSADASGLDPDSKVVSATSDAGRLGLDVGRRSDHTAAHRKAGLELPSRHDETSRLRDAAETATLADGGVLAGELAFATGTALLHGVPSLRCDSWMEVRGVDDRFAGPYYVSGVRHRWSRGTTQGLTTEVQLGIPRPLLPPATEPGPVGSGLVIGRVAQADPDPQGRVRVEFAWRTSELRATWARIATVDAGDKRGFQFIPDPGTDVVVAFLDGSAESPVVLGTLWNGATALPAVADADNTRRAIRTRSGHRVEFADPKDAAGTVTVTSAGGRSVVLDDADGKLELRDEASGNSVTVSKAGIALTAEQGDITLESAAGKVSISALELAAKAQGRAELSAAAQLSVKATGELAIQGSIVRIN
ncbi:MAG: phage baseplate assembly protein V [Agromyces sp.]